VEDIAHRLGIGVLSVEGDQRPFGSVVGILQPDSHHSKSLVEFDHLLLGHSTSRAKNIKIPPKILFSISFTSSVFSSTINHALKLYSFKKNCSG